jgi:hypothetical protein
VIPAPAATDGPAPVPRYVRVALAGAGAFFTLAAGASLLAAGYLWARRHLKTVLIVLIALALIATGIAWLFQSGSLSVENGEIRLRYSHKRSEP